MDGILLHMDAAAFRSWLYRQTRADWEFADPYPTAQGAIQVYPAVHMPPQHGEPEGPYLLGLPSDRPPDILTRLLAPLPRKLHSFFYGILEDEQLIILAFEIIQLPDRIKVYSECRDPAFDQYHAQLHAQIQALGTTQHHAALEAPLPTPAPPTPSDITHQDRLFRWKEDDWAFNRLEAGDDYETVLDWWLVYRRENKKRKFRDIPALYRNSFSQIWSTGKERRRAREEMLKSQERGKHL
jgi:hypothetical protein